VAEDSGPELRDHGLTGLGIERGQPLRHGHLVQGRAQVPERPLPGVAGEGKSSAPRGACGPSRYALKMPRNSEKSGTVRSDVGLSRPRQAFGPTWMTPGRNSTSYRRRLYTSDSLIPVWRRRPGSREKAPPRSGAGGRHWAAAGGTIGLPTKRFFLTPSGIRRSMAVKDGEDW
jgi:hypothetical protein